VAKRVYTVLCPFSGLGAGALGFLQAQHPEASFKVIGGIDNDPIACADFERLTGAPAWCVDVTQISPRQVRERYGEEPPDVVLVTAPCKASSKLLGAKKAATPEYQEMNRLGLLWCQIMLAAWHVKRPRLILFENVPMVVHRGADMLARLKTLLRSAGYELHEGFHDCGELGNLAQHRKRYLLVARHARSVGHLLYQPPKQRVRGCGEVLGTLPLPGDPSAGPMHRLPNISVLNWIRLALIPAGGCWKDLPEGLVELRHEPWSGTYRVTPWNGPAPTVTSQSARPHSSGGFVADPRVEKAYEHGYMPLSWNQPSWTIATKTSPGCGAYAVADPRLFADNEGRHEHKYRVTPWAGAAGAVTGATRPGSGAPLVADPRMPCLDKRKAHNNVFRVTGWLEPAGAVTAACKANQGAGSVADPRLGCEPRSGAYGVRGWGQPAATITGSACIDNSPVAVADPRKPAAAPLVIVAADGTWHRPMTDLELAMLQGLPAQLNGKPLVLGGTVEQRREHTGNALPVGAAESIAGEMLKTLVAADQGDLFLSSSAIWVAPQAEAHHA
jgi:site-specific DNA-cytosine methylase